MSSNDRSFIAQQPRVTRGRAYTTPHKAARTPTNEEIQPCTTVLSMKVRRPGTPVPSLSNSEITSPESSQARSPVTPTFTEQVRKPLSDGVPSQYRAQPRKSNKDFSKKDINYSMPSPVYFTVPLTLDITVDSDAYEPQRLAPAPTSHLPRDLETSFMEWDDNSSTLDKMKKSMRLQGHKKRPTPTTLKVLEPRNLDKHINATPRVPESVHTTDTRLSRHSKQDTFEPVSNFSKPKLQASPVLEQRLSPMTRDLSRHMPQRINQTRPPDEPVSRSQTTLNTDKPLPAIQPLKTSNDTGSSKVNISMSLDHTGRHATTQPTRHPSNQTTSVGGYLPTTTKCPSTLHSSIEASESRTQSPAPTSFYTYHVTRPIYASTPQTTPQPSYVYPTERKSNTYPLSAYSLSTPAAPSRAPSTTSSKQSSRHVEHRAEPKAKLLKNWMHGIAKKASIPNLRKRN
ncbi:hypothetical protein H2198_006795 [Neophaeococcomyces mojaviensis]|uniref:Uncharacterized protein n=1 Tax=Neophaeococcomyces mojaviensis TaxID=3383035 RepID=A0ACC3A1Y9_9EURO|nr:hypothetical protein H2198_006795 [Knufia sp. JES_112]